MVKWMVKIVPILFVFFFGVILGMQHANEGMREMQGYSTSSLEEPVKVAVAEEEVSAQFLGNDVGAFNLEEKKEKLAEIQSYNAFSSLGKQLAGTVEGVTTATIDFIQSFF